MKKKIICSAVFLLEAVVGVLKAAYLTPQDFAVTDGRNEIMLGMLSKDLKLDIDLVSAAHVGFGWDSYDYEGIIIYTTYTYFRRPVEEGKAAEYIGQISVEDSAFRTLRGIAIGSGAEEVIEAYGQGSRSVMDDGYILHYAYNDLNLEFSINQQEKVSDIILFIDWSYKFEEEDKIENW